MKKITFVLLALIAGTTFAQNSATGSAAVNAEIVNPIKVTSAGILDFGRIASTTTAGDVTVSPANVRTIPNEMIVPGNTVTSVPTFTVTKETGITYGVVTSSQILKLTGSDATITIKDVITNLEANSGQTAETFTVGGTLAIGAEQAAGEYIGEVSVTVSYE